MKSLQSEIQDLYRKEKPKIESRLAEFVEIYKVGKESDIFSELVFCLLTPQSKAKSCFEAVKKLVEKQSSLKGSASDISKIIKGKVRFHNNKAKYIVEARNVFFKNNKVDIRPKLESFSNIVDLREWLVKNIKGLGYKEASHFLRNIGKGQNIAILDRHILKNLKLMGVIKEIPKTITKNTYFEIEKKMLTFAKKIGIPADKLDLILWRKQTGEYFK